MSTGQSIVIVGAGGHAKVVADLVRILGGEVRCFVDTVNAAGNSLTVLGQAVRTTAQTRFEDKSAAGLQRFSLADVRAGDLVEVRGYRDGQVIVATLLERENSTVIGGSVEVKGPATAVAPPNLTVAGVLVATESRT